jgi:SAM-dependent methyltransferase
VARGIPCLGIEPTASTADAAEKLGIPVIREFFDHTLARQLAGQSKQADLIIANNVLAHVPDINDFVDGLKAALKPGGTITLEFPHLLHLLEQTQFDTVYHEHFSYLSLYTVNRVLARAGLSINDVEELPTHGGSLRVYACHAEDHCSNSDATGAILAAEEDAGLREMATYREFQGRTDAVKNGLVRFLTAQKREGRKLAAYGAAAKGNTLLNYAGVKSDLLSFVCDAAPSKQGKYLPGSHIPIVAPSALKERKPDLILILPWNIADEIMNEHAYVRGWGGRFVVVIPELRVLE